MTEPRREPMLLDIEPNPHPDWRAADPPVCPECNTSHAYMDWECRDTVRSLYAERDRLAADLAAERARVERCQVSIGRYERAVRALWPFVSFMGFPQSGEIAELNEAMVDIERNEGFRHKQPGDLDDPATTPGTEAER